MLGTDCEESLPPYRAPSGCYNVELKADQGGLDRVQREIGQILGGKGGFGFTLNITNTFDETMVGSVKDTLAELQIWWKKKTEVTATFHLTPADEIVTTLLRDPFNVVYHPGDSILLSVVWVDWADDQDNYVWEYEQSRETEEQIYYGPMTFVAEARFRLFDETPLVYSNQVAFTVTFYQ